MPPDDKYVAFTKYKLKINLAKGECFDAYFEFPPNSRVYADFCNLVVKIQEDHNIQADPCCLRKFTNKLLLKIFRVGVLVT